MNLERRGVPRAGAPKLVELVPRADARPAPVRSRYVLRVGGVELEVDDDFDARSLGRLVGLLKSC